MVANQSEHADPPPHFWDFCPLCGRHIKVDFVKAHLMSDHKRNDDEADRLMKEYLSK